MLFDINDRSQRIPFPQATKQRLPFIKAQAHKKMYFYVSYEYANYANHAFTQIDMIEMFVLWLKITDALKRRVLAIE